MTSQVDSILSELENEASKQDQCLTHMNTLVSNTSEPKIDKKSLEDELNQANERIKELENELLYFIIKVELFLAF